MRFPKFRFFEAIKQLIAHLIALLFERKHTSSPAIDMQTNTTTDATYIATPSNECDYIKQEIEKALKTIHTMIDVKNKSIQTRIDHEQYPVLQEELRRQLISPEQFSEVYLENNCGIKFSDMHSISELREYLQELTDSIDEFNSFQKPHAA